MKSQTDWYKTFFSGFFLELWANAIPEDYTNAKVKFIKEVTAIPHKSKILDVPCGYGRHSIALANEGYSLTSIDIAEAYIQQLQEVANKQELPITAVQADILEYDLNGKYDLTLCLGNSYSYFSYNLMLQFAKKVCKTLNDVGIFFIHTGALAESLLPLLKENEWMQVKDMLFLTKRIYHTEASVLQCGYSIISEGQREDSTAYQYIFHLGRSKAATHRSRVF